MKRRFWIILIALISCVSIVIVLWACPYVSWSVFESDCLNTMKNLNSSETKTALRNMFDRDYNFTELYQWEHKNVKFVTSDETFERSKDPLKILEIGKGKCQEFSILYVALCLAHNYQSRLVVAADVSNPIAWNYPHTWAEVRLDDCWRHVDPSDQVWNQASRYKSWSWGSEIGSKIRIYAFEDGRSVDVTQYYI